MEKTTLQISSTDNADTLRVRMRTELDGQQYIDISLDVKTEPKSASGPTLQELEKQVLLKAQDAIARALDGMQLQP